MGSRLPPSGGPDLDRPMPGAGLDTAGINVVTLKVRWETLKKLKHKGPVGEYLAAAAGQPPAAYRPTLSPARRACGERLWRR